MKKYVLFLMFLGISFNVYRANSQTSSPVEYMERFTTIMNQTKDESWQYLKAASKGKGARKVENKRQDLVKELYTAKGQIKRMNAYKGNTELKDAVVTYMELQYTVLKGDYDKILDMEDIAEQSYDAMEAYLLAKEQASQKLNDAYEVVDAAVEKFAAENNITLVEGEKTKRDEKMEHASEVLHYYNEAYLIFFKVYKQEAYVLEALSRNDIGAFQQHVNALKSDCKEAKQKLSSLAAFDGDYDLKKALTTAVAFYQNESETDLPTFSNFYLKKDEFEKIKKSFDAIKQKDRTQKDVDQFNQAVNSVNEASQNFNATNEKLNKERKKTLDTWSKEVDRFFSTHG